MATLNMVLERYKEYLERLNYPFIDKNSVSEVRNLFGKENRTFLLTWMLKKLVSNYNIRLEQAKRTNKLESTIANIVYENGFCRLSEKETLAMNGIATDPDVQITIFNRMFAMLLMLQAENSDKENTSTEEKDIKQIFTKLTKENLERRIIYDVELFPNFGTYEKRTEEQRQADIAACKIEIEKLTNDVARAELEIEQESSESVEVVTEEDIENLLEQLNEQQNDFKENFKDFGSCLGTTENITFNPKLEESIVECSKDLSNIVEVLEKKTCVHKISSEEVPIEQKAVSTDKNYDQFILKTYCTLENILKDYRPNAGN